MPESRNVGFRLGSLLVGAFAAAALIGCPPPQSSSPGDAGGAKISQHVLDSLRADSLQKCRFHRSFAYNYARSGLQNDAITQFQKALNYCQDDLRSEIERQYAIYLDEWDMSDSALTHFVEAGRLDTTNTRVHFWLYSHYHDVGDYDAAINELLIAARHQEDQEIKVRWMKAAADMMAAEGESDRACETYSMLQQIAPENGEIAEAMVGAGCVQDAEQLLGTLRSACAADTLGEICQRLAREEESFGNDREALDIYLRFAENGRDDIPTWDAVLRTSRRLGANVISLRALRELVRLEDGRSERVAALVDELFAQKRYADGAESLLPALRSNPENAHLLYLAGLYYTRPNSTPQDSVKALGYLDRAVRTNDPDWKRTALGLHDAIEPPLGEEEINQAKFFGRSVERLHRCTIPGREKQNEVLDQ